MTTALALPQISDAALPGTYERAKEALVRCHAIDECKDWADKAAALASYAKQADDDTLQKLALRIQARAIRRCGELLQTFQTSPHGGRPKNGDGIGPVSQTAAGEDAGMSERQIKTAVRVANVPAEEFEAAVEGDYPPTVTELANRGTAHRPGMAVPFTTATALIGYLKALASFCQEQAPEHVAAGVQSSERIRIETHIEAIGIWLETFTRALEDSCSHR